MSENNIQPPPTKDNLSLDVNEENFPKTINVKFISKSVKEKVGNEVFEIPSTLTRYGLSEIVNNLLKHTTPIPYEFLIQLDAFQANSDGKEKKMDKKVFLRTSLKEFFIVTNQWPETVTILEYIESSPSPKNTDIIPHDDWVSVIRHAGDEESGILLSGCYDGVIRFWNPKDLSLVNQYRYFSAISDVDMISLNSEMGSQIGIPLAPSSSSSSSCGDDLLLMCCGKSEFSHLLSFNIPSKTVSRHRVFTGHSEKVNCVKIAPLQDRVLFFSGGNDKVIKIYYSDSSQREQEQDDEQQQQQQESDEIQQQKKRRKLETQKPTFSLLGHKLSVNCFDYSEHEKAVYSGSSDHTIKCWDLNQTKLQTTLRGSKVVTCMSYNPNNHLMLSGHPDYQIRMWDVREGGKTAPSLFRSHKGWIRSIQWGNGENNSNYFMSGSDDNMVKQWDIRSAIPLHSIQHHVEESLKEEKEEEKNEENTQLAFKSFLSKKRNPFMRNRHKVLAVRYANNSNDVFFSGSTDCQLKKHVSKRSN